MTKEERARKFANKTVGQPYDAIARYDGYIQGATDQDPISRAEQKKIDIEKACEWLKEELYTDHNEADFRHPDFVQSRSYFKAEELVNEFRKAMEEQAWIRKK